MSEDKSTNELQETELGVDSYLLLWKTWPEIKVRLMSGATLADVTKWIRENEGDAKVRSENAIVKALSRIRAELRKSEAQSKLAELQGKADEAAAKPEGPEKTQVYVDVLDAVMELFTIQMSRIKEGRAIEEKVKYLITKLTQDIGEAREILKFMFEVQQELGLTKRKPSQLDSRFGALTLDQRMRVGRMLEMIREKVKLKELEDKHIDEATTEVIEQTIEGEVLTNTVVEPTEDLPFE